MDYTKNDQLPDRLLVALGGNAIHPESIRGSGQEQFAIAAEAARALLPVLTRVAKIVITHGNGPGVGKVPLFPRGPEPQ